MKNEFLVAMTQLAAEKNLPPEVVFEAVEAALASAYKKDDLAQSDVVVKIDKETGEMRAYTRRTVVAEVEDPETEISLEAARAARTGVALGDVIDTEVPAQHGGRVAAQTAKQVVLQRLREAEREVVYDEYSGREGDIVSGEVVRMEGRNAIIDLGKTEALLPSPEQVRNEHYRPGQRLKLYVIEVYKAAKGPQVIVSRTHKNLIRRLFELEVPEIFKGVVEIKGIAREAGYRTKVAVWSNQDGVDPVGACVGLRGLRIQNVVNELNGERIDVVLWAPKTGRFVAHALSPAQVVGVRVDTETTTAEVVVPDRQLSLAIGKEGQNARLAAKLTGWRIDIKSQSAYDEAMEQLAPEEREALEAEAAAREEADEPAAAEEAGPELAGTKALTPEEEAVIAYQAEKKEAQETAAATEEAGEGAAEEGAEEDAVAMPAADDKKSQIRFAEEVLATVDEESVREAKGEDEVASEPARPKRTRRPRRGMYEEEDEDEEYDYQIR